MVSAPPSLVSHSWLDQAQPLPDGLRKRSNTPGEWSESNSLGEKQDQMGGGRTTP
jgi:hypothetical protein